MARSVNLYALNNNIDSDKVRLLFVTLYKKQTGENSTYLFNYVLFRSWDQFHNFRF